MCLFLFHWQDELANRNFMEAAMVKEIQPKDTTRTAAYELWMKAPNPMVTF